MSEDTKIHSKFQNKQIARVVWLMVLSLFTTMFFSGCEQKPQVDPSGNTIEPTPALVTSAPEVTEPVSSTGTPIVEVVPTQQELPQQEYSVDELVISFNLKETPGYEDRTFSKQTIDGVEYVVDGYNNAPKLINENGVWRELDYHSTVDAGVMYGDKARQGGGIYKDGSYIVTQEMHSGSGPNSILIAPNFTGDWIVKETQYGKVFSLVTALNVGGTTHAVELDWDSLDDTPAHVSTIWCGTDNGGNGLLIPGATNEYVSFMLPDALPALRVGMPIGAEVRSGGPLPDVTYYSYNPSNPESNNEQAVFMTKLYNADPAAYSLTKDEYADTLRDGSWPDRAVTVALDNGPVVAGSSLKECFASFKRLRASSSHIEKSLIAP